MHPSIHPSFLSILSIYLSIYSSIFSSIEDIYQSDLFILSILPTYPDRYIHLSVSVYILLSIYYLYSSNLSIYLSISIHPIYLSINLFIYLSRKQRPANPPVQRIVLNPVLEQTIVAAESPRRTITQKIKVIIFQ